MTQINAHSRFASWGPDAKARHSGIAPEAAVGLREQTELFLVLGPYAPIYAPSPNSAGTLSRSSKRSDEYSTPA